MTEEIEVGHVGPLQITVTHDGCQQFLIVRGYRSDALPRFLQLLGLDVREQDGRCYVPDSPTTDQVLLDMFNLICALRYMRPTFGQLLLFGEEINT